MAQTKISNTGLFEPGIYLLAPLATGLPPDLADMDWIGNIVPDSLTREDDENTSVQLKSQESGDTWQDLLTEIGTKKFTFSTWNFKTDNLLKAMGGTVDANGSWLAPVKEFRGDFYSMAYVSRADEDTGLHTVINYPKVQLMGKMEGIQQEGDGNKLMFSGVIFTPENATAVKQSARVIDVVPVAPTNPVTDDTADTFEFTPIPAFPTVTLYEYSDDTGSTYNDVTVNPITGISGAVAVGALLVRLKALTTGDTKHKAGFTLANTEEFTV